VSPILGPDATGVGWVYEYALIAKEPSLAELRSLQDWPLRYGLSKDSNSKKSVTALEIRLPPFQPLMACPGLYCFL
jgi:hypothetical protein